MSPTVIHPKTGAASIGGILGVLVNAILVQCGVHLVPELQGAITAVLAAGASYLVPAGAMTELATIYADAMRGSKKP